MNENPDMLMLRGLLLLAREAEDNSIKARKAGDLIQAERWLERRNERAALVFKVKRWRKVVTLNKGVETWWDNQSRNWITYGLDGDGQYDGLSESNFTGHRDDAAISHFWALCKLLAI